MQQFELPEQSSAWTLTYKTSEGPDKPGNGMETAGFCYNEQKVSLYVPQHRAPAALQQLLSNTQRWHQALGQAPAPHHSQADLGVTCEGKGQSHWWAGLLLTQPCSERAPTAKAAGNYSQCFGGLVSVVIRFRELRVSKKGKGWAWSLKQESQDNLLL